MVRRVRWFLIVVSICCLLVAPAVAQRHGGGSHSSHSRSTSGLVHVRGYYRKDGTYVRPHYRTRPDGIITNNLSYQGISLIDTSGLDSATYPLGAWSDPNNPQILYNTPFLGITADMSRPGVIVRSSSDPAIASGFTIRRYRRFSTEAWKEATTWPALSQFAMDSDQNEIIVSGVSSTGAESEQSLSVQNESQWSGGLTDGVATPFAGVTTDAHAFGAIVRTATIGSNLAAGDKITGIRLLSDTVFTAVVDWKDVRSFLRDKGSPRQAVVRRLRVDGTEAISLVECLDQADISNSSANP